MRKSSERLSRRVLGVGHDRRALCEHPIVVEPERRHLAVGVELEVFRRLPLAFERHLLRLDQRPGFVEPDMGRIEQAPGLYSFSIVSSSPTPRQSWFARSPGAILLGLYSL